jgi:hypothetical protein
MILMLPHTPVIEFTDYCVDCMKDFSLEVPCCCDAVNQDVRVGKSSVTMHHEGRCRECCGHTPKVKL